MKKFLCYILIIFCFTFVGVVNVKAASITKGEKGTYIFKWENLSYDNNDYKLTCSNAQITSGDLSVKDHPSGSITFKPINSNGTVECKIYKDDPSSGNPVLTSASITLGTTPTQAPQTTQAQTPTTTTQARSNNNNIKTLKVTGDDGNEVVLSPAFKSDVYEYSATVASTVRTVDIVATLDDSKANMVLSNNANEELEAGENNKITITVTAEDGSKRAYVLNIKREALTADATLKELTIKEVDDFKLKKDKFTYTVKIGKNVKKLTINYVLDDENASVDIEGNKNLKDGSVVKVIVTAQDGTKKVYTLNISKETEVKKQTSNIAVEKNPLVIMGLSIIAFGLIGGIIYVIKK